MKKKRVRKRGVVLDSDGNAVRYGPRWAGVKMERLAHPLDAMHEPHALASEVERAEKMVRRIIERIGFAEAMWVAEQIGFEYGVSWWGGKAYISLSDLQLVAFAAAMRAHREAIYPKRSNGRDVKHNEPRKKRT